ncbi:MAG: thioredoxin [Clostridiales bacterium]|nr:thioredoxin [Clostridiales bacterium]
MVNELYSEEFSEKVLNSDKIAVVDFFATWCGPCKMLSPVLEKLSEENSGIEFFKVDIDQNEELANEYSVSSVPNVLIFKNGEFVENSIGCKPKDELQKLLDSVK